MQISKIIECCFLELVETAKENVYQFGTITEIERGTDGLLY